MSSEFLQQIQQRRTFAIISHPDAGKTTMTEKLLLFGNAIQLAGTVKSRKSVGTQPQIGLPCSRSAVSR